MDLMLRGGVSPTSTQSKWRFLFKFHILKSGSSCSVRRTRRAGGSRRVESFEENRWKCAVWTRPLALPFPGRFLS